MEYRRTNPHSSPPTSPSHTHTYTNSIPLDSWSIFRDSTTPLGSLCVHRPCQGYTHNPTGLPVRSYNPTGLRVSVCSQGCTRTQTPNKGAPHNLSPPSWVLCFCTKRQPRGRKPTSNKLLVRYKTSSLDTKQSSFVHGSVVCAP